jgi:hypothetical protein
MRQNLIIRTEERNPFGKPKCSERVTSKSLLDVCIGLKWLGMGSVCGSFLKTIVNFVCHGRHGISCSTEQLTASNYGLCYTEVFELFGQLINQLVSLFVSQSVSQSVS